jgi:hypothetical protein
VTFTSVTDFIGSKGVIPDRFWVGYFVQQQAERLCMQKATIFEKDQCDLSRNDLKHYFETVDGQIKSLSIGICMEHRRNARWMTQKDIFPGMTHHQHILPSESIHRN